MLLKTNTFGRFGLAASLTHLARSDQVFYFILSLLVRFFKFFLKRRVRDDIFLFIAALIFFGRLDYNFFKFVIVLFFTLIYNWFTWNFVFTLSSIIVAIKGHIVDLLSLSMRIYIATLLHNFSLILLFLRLHFISDVSCFRLFTNS